MAVRYYINFQFSTFNFQLKMKQEYIKPTVFVVMLQHKSQILASSLPTANGLTNNPEGFIWEEDGLEDTDILR